MITKNVFSQESKGVSHETLWAKHARKRVQGQRKGGITVNWSGNSHDASVAGAEHGRNKSK